MNRNRVNSLRSARGLTVALALAALLVLTNGPAFTQAAAPTAKSAKPDRPIKPANGKADVQAGPEGAESNDDQDDSVFPPAERSTVEQFLTAKSLVERHAIATPSSALTRFSRRQKIASRRKKKMDRATAA